MASKLDKFKKAMEKKDISIKMSEPDQWISIGNCALNYICTGSFSRGLPNRRLSMLCGVSGSGKSLLMGHIAKSLMQDPDRTVFYIDTEDAIDPGYLQKIGVDYESEQFCPIRLSTIEEFAEVSSEIFRTFDKDDKIAVLVDSLGMLDTDDHKDAFEKKGEMKNDMGIFAKKLKRALKGIAAKVGEYDCFFVCNQHVYANQNVLDGRGTHVVSGGEAQVYIPSISLMLKKLKLKEEGKITGIRLKATTEKTRFTQLGLACELSIPYETGIDPYDGVLEILEENSDRSGLHKTGGWFSYVDDNGETVKFQKSNSKEHLSVLMERMEPSTLDEQEEHPEL